MSKRPSKRTPAAYLFEWRVVRLKKSPAALIGYVTAPDQEQAIAKAIEAFGISDPVARAACPPTRSRKCGSDSRLVARLPAFPRLHPEVGLPLCDILQCIPLRLTDKNDAL
jgi:hypothetical protein